MILYRLGNIFAILPMLCFFTFFIWKFRQKKYTRKINLILAAFLCIILYCLTNGTIEIIMKEFRDTLSGEQWNYAKYILKNNVYNLILYLIFIFYKMFQERKKRERLMLLMILSCIFAVGQIIFYHYLFLINIQNLTRDFDILTYLSLLVKHFFSFPKVY